MSCWYDGHLNLFRLLKHNATDSVAYKNRSLFLSVLEAGRPRSGSRCQHTGFWGRDELISRVLLIRALISFMQPSPLWPNYLPRTPYLIPSHLKLGFQHMNFGETQTFRSHHGMRLTKSKIEWLNQVNHSPERGLCRYPDISFQTCSPDVPSTEPWRKRRSVSSRSTVSKQKVDNVRTWWRMGEKMLDNIYPLWVQVTP